MNDDPRKFNNCLGAVHKGRLHKIAKIYLSSLSEKNVRTSSNPLLVRVDTP